MEEMIVVDVRSLDDLNLMVIGQLLVRVSELKQLIWWNHDDVDALEALSSFVLRLEYLDQHQVFALAPLACCK